MSAGPDGGDEDEPTGAGGIIATFARRSGRVPLCMGEGGKAELNLNSPMLEEKLMNK